MAELNLDITPRFDEWLDQCRRNSFALLPTFESEGEGICYASVMVLPKIDAAEDPGQRDPFTLFGGELHGDTASKFRTALKSIGLIYGVDEKEALGIMAQTLILVASIAQLKQGVDPTLTSYCHRLALEPGKEDAYLQLVNRPLLQVEQALEVWFTNGARIDLRDVWKPPEGVGIGRLYYLSFPPVWLTKEKLDWLYRNQTEGFRLPLQVDSELFATVQSFSQLLEHQQQTGFPLQMQIASPGNPVVERGVPEIPRIDLTEEELQECDRHQFKSRMPIEITGQAVSRRSNEVKIAGAEVILPDADFVLFLRLVVALFETEDGFLAKAIFSGIGSFEEQAYAPNGIDQALSRLRAKLRPVSQGLPHTQFIETRRKRIRLSTHRKYVIVDRGKFLGHDDARVKELAKRLPAD